MLYVKLLKNFQNYFKKNIFTTKFNYNREYVLNHVNSISDKFSSYLNSENYKVRLIARSCAQYSARNILYSKNRLIITEIISFFLIVPRYFYLILRPRKKIYRKAYDLVDMTSEYVNKEYFPNHLRVKSLSPRLNYSKMYLSVKDSAIFFTIFFHVFKLKVKYPFFYLYYILKVLSIFRQTYDNFLSNEIIFDRECGFSVSILTLLCRKKGIITHNIMHGDKFYSLTDCFFEVDYCYCFNEFYIKMLKDEKAKAKFQVYKSKKFNILNISKSKIKIIENVYFILPQPFLFKSHANFVYCIEKAIQALNKLAKNGRVNVFLRWHPSHIGDLSTATRFISRKIILDDPLRTPISKVIDSSSIFIGLGSSVLLEGACKGKEIIILKNKLVEDVSAYHYMYKMKNVKIVEVDDLYDHLVSVLKFSKPC